MSRQIEDVNFSIGGQLYKSYQFLVSTLAAGSSASHCCMSMSFSTGRSSWKASCTYEPLLDACKGTMVSVTPKGVPLGFPLMVTTMASCLLTSRYRLVTRELVSGRSWDEMNGHRCLQIMLQYWQVLYNYIAHQLCDGFRVHRRKAVKLLRDNYCQSRKKKKSCRRFYKLL